MLTKEQILAADDRKPVKVSVPVWGGDVYIRGLTGTERDELESWINDNPSAVGMRARVVAMGLCDGAGESLGFSPAEVVSLGEKSGGVLDELFSEIMRMSKYSEVEIRKLEGNCEAGQNVVSGCV